MRKNFTKKGVGLLAHRNWIKVESNTCIVKYNVMFTQREEVRKHVPYALKGEVGAGALFSKECV